MWSVLLEPQGQYENKPLALSNLRREQLKKRLSLDIGPNTFFADQSGRFQWVQWREGCFNFVPFYTKGVDDVISSINSHDFMRIKTVSFSF